MELLAVGGYQSVGSDTQDTLVPAFQSLDGLKPNLRPWLIEEGMTYISQGEKNHLPRMREKRPREPRKSIHKQWASSLLRFLFHSSKHQNSFPSEAHCTLHWTPVPWTRVPSTYSTSWSPNRLDWRNFPLKKVRYFWASVKHQALYWACYVKNLSNPHNNSSAFRDYYSIFRRRN